MTSDFRKGLLGTASHVAPAMLGHQQGAAAPVVEEEEEPNVTEQEQEQYDLTVGNAFKLIYSEGSMEKILPTLNSVEGLANAVAHIFSRLNDTAKRSGRPIPPDVLFKGGEEVLGRLAELAESGGVKTFAAEEIEQALYRAVDTFQVLQQKTGNLDPSAAADEFADLLDADEKGRLGELLPDAAEHFGTNNGPLPAPAPQGGPIAPQGGPAPGQGGPLPPQGAAAPLPEEVL